MRTIKVSLVLLFAVNLISFTTVAQDLVYFRDGKFSGGKVTWQDMTFIRFRDGKNNDRDRVEASDLDRYYLAVNKTWYYSKSVPKEFREFDAVPVHWIMKQEVRGKISIYSRGHRQQTVNFGSPASGSGKITYYFIEKDDSGLKTVAWKADIGQSISNEAKDIVHYLLSDNTELAARFMNTKAKIKSIIQFAQEYNKWSDEQKNRPAPRGTEQEF